jgi:hypothetical protein
MGFPEGQRVSRSASRTASAIVAAAAAGSGRGRGAPATARWASPDGLDLLEPELIGDRVEAREELVERPHEHVWWRPGGFHREPDCVDEQDGRLLDPVGDPGLARFFLPLLEALDDRLRQDVQQERLGASTLAVELSLTEEEEASGPVEEIRGDHAEREEREQIEERKLHVGRGQLVRREADHEVPNDQMRP